MDISNHMAAFYPNIHIHLNRNNQLLSFHLLAILILSRHAHEQKFLHAVKAPDMLAPCWKDMAFSVSTDKERKMTGQIQGVAARFDQTALSRLFHIWCGLHHLDINLPRFFVCVMGEQV